ncbi:MAG: hypothetical protein NC084_11215 [Bacteroides sp.]|nr:hypothetical protein [Bacteroides sp.]
MEIFVGIAVLLTLVFCLTGELGAALMVFAGIVILFLWLLLGFFLYFFFTMLRAGKRSARFARFERDERVGFERAVYEVEGEEIPAVFPAEPILRARLYRPERPSAIRLSAKKKRLYDRPTCATVCLGTAAFLILSPLTTWGMLLLLGL